MDNRLFLFKPYLQESHSNSIMQIHLFIPLNEGPLADRLRYEREPDFGDKKRYYPNSTRNLTTKYDSNSPMQTINYREKERETLRNLVPSYKYRY